MLKRVGMLPNELLMRKFTEISGKDEIEVRKIQEKESIETIADMVEDYFVNKQLKEKMQSF